MFGREAKLGPNALDCTIERVLNSMHEYGTDSPEYPTLLSYLERLIKLKTEDRPARVSRDTLATVGGNLMVVLVIVMYENKHVMVSKALGFILKPK